MLKKSFIILIGFLFLTINTYAETINFYQYHDSSQESINFRQEPSIITTDNIKVKWERDPNNLYNKYNVFFSKFNEDWVLISDQATINAFNNKYNTYLNIPECEIIETDEYIILTTKKIGFPYGMSDTRKSIIYVIDKNSCNMVKKCEIDKAIGTASYVDGVFYITEYMAFYSDEKEDMPYEEYQIAASQATYCTSDFETWYEYSNNGTIPITNGVTKLNINNSLITSNDKTNFSELKTLLPQNIYLFNDNGNTNEIIYESINISQISVLKDLYIAIPSTELNGSFYVSLDGIYFNRIDLPQKDQNLYMISEAKSDKLICSINSYSNKYQGFNYMFCSYNDLKETTSNCPLYVCVNNKYLGFSQPPVMESDRILVPMRFLFEQMGAEVDWNDETQTATAKISARGGGENTVTFSIDNTTAYVNGAETTMDVPARLINDQTFVPLRFLSENLGYTVEWDEPSNTAIITTE